MYGWVRQVLQLVDGNLRCKQEFFWLQLQGADYRRRDEIGIVRAVKS